MGADLGLADLHGLLGDEAGGAGDPPRYLSPADVRPSLRRERGDDLLDMLVDAAEADARFVGEDTEG